MPASFPEECRVDVVTTEGGRSLVAALELVSPGNKDRESKRRLFAAKCAAYLARGVGLVVLDLVTTRTANLHNELVELMRLGSDCLIPAAPHTYASAYRPLSEAGTGRIEVWPVPLSLGQPLPTVPLSLSAELCVPVDLEAAYQDACRRRRLEEVTVKSRASARAALRNSGTSTTRPGRGGRLSDGPNPSASLKRPSP